MRHRIAIVGLALLLGACGSSSGGSASGSGSGGGAGGGSGPARCGPSGGRTLAASSSARVYVSGNAVYACSGKTRVALGRAGVGCLGTSHLQKAAVAGPIVAYALTRCGVDTGSTTVNVRRMTDGKVLSTNAAITKAVAPESFQSVTSLLVRPDGAVAWISELGSVISHRHLAEVHRVDTTGFALLDAGPSGSLTGLRLSDSKVLWRHAGAERSAPIG